MPRSARTAVVVLSAALLCGVLATSPAAAAPKPGATCAKQNDLAFSAKQRFVCKPKRGVLVWQKVTKPAAAKRQARTSTVPVSLPQAAPVATAPVASAPASTRPVVVAPAAAPTAPVETATPVNQTPVNPVVARIEKLLAVTARSTPTTPVAIRWEVSPEFPADRLQNLFDQHQRLADAYGEMYRWDGGAVGVVSTDPVWIRQRLEAMHCPQGTLEFLRILEQRTDDMAAGGTTFCGGVATAFFLNRNGSDAQWEHLLGSEFGSMIQRRAAARSTTLGNLDWYTTTPTWYSEGGQTMLSAVAAAKTSGVWRFDSRQRIAALTGWCDQDTMASMRCHEPLGSAALELAVALYGWDAPVAMYEHLSQDKDQARMFGAAFGDRFEVFAGWADAYFAYLMRGTPLPEELVSRLAG
jgi:hypothetical protein